MDIDAQEEAKILQSKQPNSTKVDRSHRDTIQRFWSGLTTPVNRRVQVGFQVEGDLLNLDWLAPNLNNKGPITPPGPMWELWNYDVVEFFFLGEKERYLELEFSPHGHYLALQMVGIRNPVTRMLPLETNVSECNEEWWSGNAKVPLSYLPNPVLKWNAFAIFKEGASRHFCALSPGHGPPDFHQLSCFQDMPFLIR